MANTTAAKQTIETDEFSFGEIRARLQQPIEPARIMRKEIGGRSIAYVNITDMKDVLDERVPVWESHVVDTKQIGENLCVVLRLSIHTTQGVFSQDGTGLETLTISGYGDPFSNAYAQAFRRACEGFGLGRELWRKDHGRGHQPNGGGGGRAVTSARRPAKPAHGGYTDARDAVTSAQLVLLERKLLETGVGAADLLAGEFADVADVARLSKAAASYLITQLSTPAS